jgi:integrase
MATTRKPKHVQATVEWRNGRAYARLWLLDGRRKAIKLTAGISEEKAREAARAIAERVEAGEIIFPADDSAPLPIPPAGEPGTAWRDRWLQERERQGNTSVRDDRQRLRSHVDPVLGDTPIPQLGRADMERLVATLDDKVTGGELAWKTAIHVWALARTMMRDACSSKRLELRCREDDPTANVRGPDKGEDLARTYLYPAEMAKLLACEAVPVEWRRRYALAAYTLSRAGELRALRWDAVDLEHGVIMFRQASDRRKSGRAKGTKTGKVRRVPVETSLRPLLLAMRAESGGAGPVVHIPVSKGAESLRKHLALAGITRTELFPPPEGDDSVAATWAPLTFHDLRGTGVTWCALRGDEPLVIQQRAGHENFKTTERYLREAETLGRHGGEPFPPLPASLLIPKNDTQSEVESYISAEPNDKTGAGNGIRTRADHAFSAENGPISDSGVGSPEGANPAEPGRSGERVSGQVSPLRALADEVVTLAERGDLGGAMRAHRAMGALLAPGLAGVDVHARTR